MTEPKILPRSRKTNIYKCPYEGANCPLNKHCHAIETPDRLPPNFTAVLDCPQRKAKIVVTLTPMS